MPLPTDTYLTLAQLNQLFQLLALNILGYGNLVTPWQTYLQNPVGNAPTNPYYFVRVEWPTVGAPAWGRTEDICFVGITQINSPYSQQRQLVYTPLDDSNAVESAGWTVVNSVVFNFYGPNSFDNARLMQDRIFRQENHDQLAQSNVYLIPVNIFPRRTPELFQGQWWERSDLVLMLNELVIRNEARPYIAEVDVTITQGADILTDSRSVQIEDSSGESIFVSDNSSTTLTIT